MKQGLIALMALLMLACIETPLSSQTRDSAVADVCLRTPPGRRCKWIALTELDAGVLVSGRGGSRQVLTPEHSYDWKPHRELFHASLGLLRTVTAHDAIGASMMVRLEFNGPLYGVKGRYRHTFADKGASVDVGVGLMNGSQNDRFDYNTGGFTADVAVTVRRPISVFANVETLRADQSKRPLLHVGVRVNSLAGLIAAGAYVLTAGGYIASGQLVK